MEYEYDDLYRLTRESISVDGVEQRSLSYTYDLVGNRLTRGDSAAAGFLTSIAYTYDPNDRVEREYSTYPGALDVDYDHDDNGNLTARSETGQFGSSSASYTWDIAGRLVAADTDGDQLDDLAFRSNDDGIRVARTDDGQQTEYLVDPLQAYDQVLEEYDGATGDLVASYVHGLDLIAQDRDGVRSYYHADGLGSTRTLSDATGAVTDTYVYEAYGRLIDRDGTTANPYRFAGEWHDDGLGWYDNRARYLDVDMARFTSRDPYEGELLRPLTFHDYAYAHNDPANNTDPTGMFSIAGVTISVNVGSTIEGMYTGAVVGAVFGGSVSGIDAYLGGEDWQSAAIYGALWGGALGAVGGSGAPGALWKLFSHQGRYALKVAFALADTIGTAAGVAESALNGNEAQSLGRLLGGLIGLGLIRRLPACFVAGTPIVVSDLPERHGPTEIESSYPARWDRHRPWSSINVEARPTLRTVSIEDIRLGGRVLGTNPQCRSAEATEPGEATWRKLCFRAAKPDGRRLEFELLRPASWVAQTCGRVGGIIEVDLPEMGVSGPATLVGMEPCPPIEGGEGNIVTGRFRHEPDGDLLDIRLEGWREPIGCTPQHPFWSEDQREFVPAGRLAVGERLRTHARGIVRIHSIARRPREEWVYNLEVHGEHVYEVSGLGVLVHNNYVQIASAVARRFGLLDCVPASNAIVKALKAQGIRGEVIHLRTINKHGFILSDKHGSSAISRNGHHVGVRVEGMVFDNIHPDGIPYEKWLQDFHADPPVSIDKVESF